MEAPFYRRPVLLNPAVHQKNRIAPAQDYMFAKNANALYLAAVELMDAAKEYPIVFARSPQGYSPVAMLGLREGENLYVNEQGAWTGRYLPAFVRRYPFVLANIQGLGAQQQLGVCVDESFLGWNTEVGEALFQSDGSHSSYLKNAIDFLTRFQREYERTELFCKHLQELDILKPMDAQAKLDDGRSFVVNGLWVVDEVKLRQLPDDNVLALWRSGEASWIDAHLMSLSNLPQLVEKLSALAPQ